MSVKTFFPNKITTKDCGLNVTSLNNATKELDEGDSVHVLRVAGVITNTESGETSIGPYTCYIGDHFAENMLTGNQYSSKKLIMPPMVSSILDDLLAGSNGGAVKYAFDLMAAYSDNKQLTAKYKYIINPIIKPDKSDVIKSILAEIEEPKKLSG